MLRVAPVLLVLLACCWLAGGGSAQADGTGREPTVAEQVQAVLERTSRPSESMRAAERIAALGPGALDSVFAHLGTEPPPDTAVKAALIAAVGMMPRAAVLAHLAEVGRRASDERTRVTALAFLGIIGERNELKLAIEVACPNAGDTPPSPTLLESLSRSLLAIVSREPASLRDLQSYFEDVGPGVQTAIVSAIRTGAGPRAPAVLAGLLGKAGPDSDALLLAEIGEAARNGWEEDLLACERVRAYLGNPDKRLAVLACACVRKLADDRAVPDLIVLLCDDDPNVRAATHAALVELTRTSLAPEPEPWTSWLDDGLSWWDERADACRAALVSGTATEAAEALAEVARQRLFAHDVVKLLGLALHRAEPDLAEMACKALAGTPPGAARAALEALESLPETKITLSVRAALLRAEHERQVPQSTSKTPFSRKILP